MQGQWWDLPDQPLFAFNYGATVPRFLDVQLWGWADFGGNSCNFEGGSGDKNQCGWNNLVNNLNFRDFLPATTHTLPDMLTCSGNWGATITLRYSTPRPGSITSSGSNLCANAPVNLTWAMEAVPGNYGGAWSGGGGTYELRRNGTVIYTGSATTFTDFPRCEWDI
jgi:hypothetical protein